jgi:DNA-binding LacI/PurR family transcriptional regulator
VVVHSGDATAYAGFDRVCSDHAGGACELTRRLIAAGRRRIRQVWHSPVKPYWLLEREAGHARAMAEAGLAVAPPICIPEEPKRSVVADPDNLDQRARAYLGFLFEPLNAADAPDALIAVNDANAASVATACRMLGRQVHDQVAVAGFDANWTGSWEWPSLGLAPFLSAHKHNHRVGRALAEVLAERLAGRSGAAPIVRTMPIEAVGPLAPA